MTMQTTIMNIARSGLVGLVLIAPIIGCTQKIYEPKREDYNNYSAGLARCKFLRVVDEDNDGEADIIGEIGSASFIAEGYQAKRYDTTYAKIMTPEMRAAATKELHAERELQYLVDKARFDQDKARVGDVK